MLSTYIQSNKDSSDFLIKAKLATGSWQILSKITGVSPRTLRNWYLCQSSIPLDSLKLLSNHLGVSLPKYKAIDILRLKRNAAKRGGLRRIALYGNPGTITGRIKGALRSIRTQSKNPYSPFIQKKISIPKRSSQLAEFVGILLGDGHVGKRQIIISIGADEYGYTKYISNLSFKLFQYRPSIKKKNGVEVYTLVFSRTALVTYIKKIGLTDSHKVKSQSNTPLWILNNKNYSKACVRGLFDTDGSFFIDRHLIKNSLYYNAGIAFTNYSLPLLKFFYFTLVARGFHPTVSSGKNVFLRRDNEIRYFFKDIGSNNPKHLRKFSEFVNKYPKGKVPKRS